MTRRPTRGRGLRLILASGLALAVTTAVNAETSGSAPWGIHLDAVREALGRNDLATAQRAWHEAYIAAAGAWRWEGLIEVGDAALRMTELSGRRQAAGARARNLYLAALVRAEHQDSVDGVLRAAEAFARLGDREVMERSLRIAERLARETGDAEAPTRVRAAAARLADVLLATGQPPP